MKTLFVVSLFSLVLPLGAELWLPALFSDHMVLQRELENPVWGTAEAGVSVTVQIGEQTHQTQAGEDGSWRLKLDPMPAGGPYELVVQAGETRVFTDVLVGEVWFCSGQSNMQWSVARTNEAPLERATAHYPKIRMISVPKVASQESLRDFDGAWEVCSPETVEKFSAVGYFFGRRIHMALDVPIGLVNNAWGGSAAEAWLPRELLLEDDRYRSYVEEWDEKVAQYDEEAFAREVARKKAERNAWRKNGRQGPAPRVPRNPIRNNKRPGNIYHGVLAPTIGYGIRGFIWYQGETNAGRAYDYRYLFPLLIQTFRDQWDQGDFPFYWVQLADFKPEVAEPEDPDWAWLRESQTLTLDKVSHGGQAVIIDAGEGNDIHPRNKQTVANRLARIALAQQYGLDMPHQSPRFASMVIKDDKAVISFQDLTERLTTFDVDEPKGFAIAGEDRVFHWAKAKIVKGKQIEVWSEKVPVPVAVRYAWANNPVCNIYTDSGLPLTPFRTDEWPQMETP